MYIQDFYLIKIKCFDGVEPMITGESEEKPKVDEQINHRVENDAHGPLYDIVATGDH